ncbi:MAG: AI-2E family transporter [Fuerstiella sp.]|nr:AI-2E family transporter [Fuerstiella sp.]
MSPPADRYDGARYLYLLAAFIVVVAGIRAAESILNPLLLAVFLSVMCAPVYLGLLRRGVSQWLSLVIVAGGLSAVGFLLLAVVMQSISGFNGNQERYRQQIPERKEELRRWITAWSVEPREPDPESHRESEPDDSEDAALRTLPAEESPTWLDQIYDQFDVSTVISLVVRLVGSIQSLLSNVLLILLTAVFILLEAGSFTEKLSRAFPQRAGTTEQAAQMIRSVQRYIAIKTVISIATAMLIGIWLKLFDVSYISLWVLLAFLFNFIPNIGSIIAAVPAVLIAWLELGVQPAAGCAIGYVIVNVAIGNLLEPRLMGERLGLSPLVIFCSMVFWGWVLGPVGMLLSVPLTMTLHIVLDCFDDTRWIATLMGGRIRSDQSV